MVMKNSKDKRDVDRLAKNVSAWWKKSLRYATLKQILTWKVMLVIFLMAGVIAGIIWSVQMKIETRSEAAFGEATLTWEPNKESNLAGYVVYFGTSKRAADCPTDNHGYTGKVRLSSRINSYTISNLAEGKTYYFSISAYDNGGDESCFSEEVSKIIPSTGPDKISPTVAITSPSNKAAVSGNVSIIANASDNVKVSKVEFYVNGILKSSVSASPFVYVWNTSALPDASYRLTARAYDAAGNNATSKLVKVNLKNDGKDMLAPEITITNPENEDKVSGTVKISATAKDNIAVTGMRCYIDDLMIGSSSSGSITCNWDSTKTATGIRTIRVKALDAAGNVANRSIVVTVTR